jgi:hypothetical protein
MARHRIWEPAPDDPPLLAWFEPLVALARRARSERIHWPVLVEDFDVVRRVDRSGASRIWTYRHRETGGELHVDDGGSPYAFRPHPSAGAGGRFVATPVRRAVFAADLHLQPDELWIEFPEERRRGSAFDPAAAFDPLHLDDDDLYGVDDPDAAPPYDPYRPWQPALPSLDRAVGHEEERHGGPGGHGAARRRRRHLSLVPSPGS